MVGAKLDLETGKSAEAVQTFARIEKEARASGLAATGMEAKLNLGIAQIRSGMKPAGKMTLAEVSKEARNKGYVLLAEEAGRGL
jgi:hypothetical protein